MNPVTLTTLALGAWMWLRHRNACKNVEHVAYGAVLHGQPCDCPKE